MKQSELRKLFNIFSTNDCISKEGVKIILNQLNIPLDNIIFSDTYTFKELKEAITDNISDKYKPSEINKRAFANSLNAKHVDKNSAKILTDELFLKKKNLEIKYLY